MIAKLSNGSVTPQQILDLVKSGMGWGEIMKQYDFKPGKGNSLGAIMSGHGGSSNNQNQSNGPSSGGKPNCPGNSCNAPGQSKGNPGHHEQAQQ